MRKTDGRADGQTVGDSSVLLSVRPSDRPTVLSRVRSALKQIVGMPDYARYLEHARTAHPECPVLTEREFYDRYLSTRYGNGATRCC